METDSFRDYGASLRVTGDDLDGFMAGGEEEDNRCEEE